jgi:PTH1 family peptidyl-tRNA hydrolase
MDPAAYVLQDFSTQQEEVMAVTRERAAEACQHWLAHGVVSAMNAYNAVVET